MRLVQDQRKANDYERTDRISLVGCTDSEELKQAIEENRDYICGETLAETLDVNPLAEAGADAVEKTIGEDVVKIAMSVTG